MCGLSCHTGFTWASHQPFNSRLWWANLSSAAEHAGFKIAAGVTSHGRGVCPPTPLTHPFQPQVRHWPLFGPHLEAALCDVLRTVQVCVCACACVEVCACACRVWAAVGVRACAFGVPVSCPALCAM
jgi:hypothetical protein